MKRIALLFAIVTTACAPNPEHDSGGESMDAAPLGSVEACEEGPNEAPCCKPPALDAVPGLCAPGTFARTEPVYGGVECFDGERPVGPFSLRAEADPGWASFGFESTDPATFWETTCHGGRWAGEFRLTRDRTLCVLDCLEGSPACDLYPPCCAGWPEC